MYNLNNECKFIWFCNDSINTEISEDGTENYYVEFTTENDTINIHTKINTDIIYKFEISSTNFYQDLLKQKIEKVPINQPLKISWSYNQYTVPFFEGIVISSFKRILNDSVMFEREISLEDCQENGNYKVIEILNNSEKCWYKLENESDVFQFYVKNDLAHSSCGGSFCPGWFVENNFVPIIGNKIQLKIKKDSRKKILKNYKCLS